MWQFKYIFKAIILLIICSAVYAVLSLFGHINLDPLTGIFKKELPGCGVVDSYPRANLSEAGNKGKAIYQSQCQSCHSIFKDLTGPALGTIMQNPFWSDTLKFVRYIQDPESFSKESYIVALRAKFGSKQMPFPGMSDEQLASVMSYIRDEQDARTGYVSRVVD
jgi:mono/diheme cytochrome c family protein